MMFDVDVRAPFFLTAALLPKMIARGSGAIVNISSLGASVGVPFAPVTAAAKAALESFTRSWAAAFGANGIRVNTVAPGPTRTDSASARSATRWSSWVPRRRWAGPRTRRDRRGDRFPRVAASELPHRRDRSGGRRLYRDLTDTRPIDHLGAVTTNVRTIGQSRNHIQGTSNGANHERDSIRALAVTQTALRWERANEEIPMVGAKPYGQLHFREVNGKRMAYVEMGRATRSSSARQSDVVVPVAEHHAAPGGTGPLLAST